MYQWKVLVGRDIIVYNSNNFIVVFKRGYVLSLTVGTEKTGVNVGIAAILT